MRSLLRKIAILIMPILTWPLSLFIRKENVIILQTHSMFRYGGNPKYLFEYLSTNSNYNVYWVTESEQIMSYLNSKGYKFISSNNLWEKMVVSWSAKIVIDSGTDYYNFLGLVPSSAVKICTMHGSGPKLTVPKNKDLNKTIAFIQQVNSFDYFSFCTEHAKMMVGKNQFLLHSERMVTLGAPKCDQFYDHELVKKRHAEKLILKDLIPNFDPKGKVIYYVPTFRPYPSNLPLLDLENFDKEKFDKYLVDNNYYFIYSLHSIGAFEDTVNHSDRTIFFSFKDSPLVDNNQLQMEVDLFIGDYSTLATDVAIMNKPQIFVMPDYDEMQESKGYAEDYRALIPGPEVTSYNQLIEHLDKYLQNPSSYIDENKPKVDLLLERYMDTSLTDSCARFQKFIDVQIKS